MERFLLVCLGSAVGGGARYLISGWAHQLLGSGFPHGTFVVNLLGSYLLGALMFAGVGGSMLQFAGAWPRMLPSDFRVRSLDGVADDWPLTYDFLRMAKTG